VKAHRTLDVAEAQRYVTGDVTAVNRFPGAGGGLWAAAMRTAVLLADKSPERSDLGAGLNAERFDRSANDAVRRALVEVLMNGTRVELVEALDETLLGLRPRPQSVLRVA
jgi:hypothetical protein